MIAKITISADWRAAYVEYGKYDESGVDVVGRGRNGADGQRRGEANLPFHAPQTGRIK
jgi:hypothetical protein